MPYGRFYETVELASYDVEILAARFGASFEQVAHCQTTLARQTARGVPFFLVRVDINCRLRDRPTCPRRAAPPALRPLKRRRDDARHLAVYS